MKARVQINVSFDADVAFRIKDAASANKQSVAAFVRQVLTAAVAAKESK